MSENITNTEALAKSYSLEFTDCGNGHVQIKGHGILVNYWPESKNRTAHIAGGPTIKHCNPYDAIKLCLSGGQPKLRPKAKSTQNAPQVDLEPIRTNPAGIRHFYDGNKPPWEFPSTIMAASDLLRIEAYKLDAGLCETCREEEDDD